MRAFLRVLLFVALGPLVGLLSFALGIGVWTFVTTGSTRDFIFGPDLFSPFILILVYSMGGVPALLDGIAAVIVARWQNGWRYWLSVAFIGAIVSAAGITLIGGPHLGLPKEGGGISAMFILFTLAGGVAGFVCTWLFDLIAAQLRPSA